MALTKSDKIELRTEIYETLLIMKYSLGLLADYRDDLRSEASDITKGIAKKKKKFKILEDKYRAAGGIGKL